MGTYLGLFNGSICLPQIVASLASFIGQLLAVSTIGWEASQHVPLGRAHHGHRGNLGGVD